MTDYDVGQIIYLLVEKSARVFPVQVVEEIVRKTIGGKQITYMVKLPNEKQSLVDLADLDAIVFIREADLKKQMITNATKAITGMVDKAVQVGNELFIPKDIKKALVDEDSDWEDIPLVQPKSRKTTKEKSILGKQNLNDQNSVQNNNKSDKIKVDLGNGMVANMDPAAAELLNR